jgi:hypothetical protein
MYLTIFFESKRFEIMYLRTILYVLYNGDAWLFF